MSLRKSCFTELLIEANGLDAEVIKSWVFCPGMLFNSPDKWWGDHGRRDFPHEGIDLCLFKNPAGRLRRIDERTRIPVMHDGMVMAIFVDFLGQAVILEHEDGQSESGKYLSVYAHTKPRDGIEPGVCVKAGDIIATIADTSRSKAKILPHLHFSMGRPSPDFIYDPFTWNNMRDPDQVALLNPLALLDWDHQLLDPQNHGCVQL